MAEKKDVEYISNGGVIDKPENLAIFHDRAVLAFRQLAELGMELQELGIDLIQSTVAIHLPDDSQPKIINLASPNVNPVALDQLLQLMGKDSGYAVHQSQIVIQMALYQVKKEKAEECKVCPDREQCDHVVEADTVQ